MRKNLEEAANIFSTMAAPVEGTETTSSFVIINDWSSPSPCSHRSHLLAAREDWWQHIKSVQCLQFTSKLKLTVYFDRDPYDP